MSGALVDLVAKGAQDVYLTGSPEVSFFRQQYKRHTNFTSKPVKLNPMGTFGPNQEISLKIPNKGDLLDYVWLHMADNDNTSSNLMPSTSKPVIFELWIGGQMVDRQDATFMILHWQKFLVDSGAKAMAIAATKQAGSDYYGRNTYERLEFIPLHFSFCDGQPLPLLALQYHEVEIKIKFSSSDPGKVDFYANYIMLDTIERDYFVNKEHEILIEQVQRIPVTTRNGSNYMFDLSLLNHPVKSIHWSNVSNTHYTSSDVMLYLNGTQLFDSPMPDIYFSSVQGYYHSEHASELLKLNSFGNSTNDDYQGGKGLKMYSFAQKASKHVPTGSCNFSRLDNAEMKFVGSSENDDTYLYAVNWNVLRIKNGMAGVAFSN